jgi:hypothetical protein
MRKARYDFGKEICKVASRRGSALFGELRLRNHHVCLPAFTIELPTTGIPSYLGRPAGKYLLKWILGYIHDFDLSKTNAHSAIHASKEKERK